MTGADVRQSSSLTSVAIMLPATVSPVLATRMVEPDGEPPGPVEMSSPDGVRLI
jgi:hypothetical protein